MKKTVSILGNLVFGICVLGLLAVFIAPPIFGVTLDTILSESMTPTLRMGGVIVIQKVDFSAVKVGDIIVFKFPEMDTPVCHRAIEKVETAEGIGFRTQGDAVEQPDPRLVKEDNLLGKVVFHLPWIGYAIKFLKTRPGFLLGIGLPVAVLMVLQIKDIWSEPKRIGPAKWRQKPNRFPAYFSLIIGLILIGALWGMMVQNNQEKNLASFGQRSEDPNQPVFLSERRVQNKGSFPLVICFFSEDKTINFSQAYFRLSPGEQKILKITGNSEEAIIKSGALFPILPLEILYQLFSWDSQLGPLLAAAIPILPLTLIAFLVFWRIASVKPKLAERARLMKRRLSYG